MSILRVLDITSQVLAGALLAVVFAVLLFGDLVDGFILALLSIN